MELDAATVTARFGPRRGSATTVANVLPLLAWRPSARQGAGLGLAICREIALAHGWVLSAHRADPGLLLRLSVPHSTG